MKLPVLSLLLGLAIAAVLLYGCSSDDTGNGRGPDNAPCIDDLQVIPNIVHADSTVTIKCYATDQDNDALYYTWNCESGWFVGANNGDSAHWHAPAIGGEYWVGVEVSDGNKTDEDTLLITVLPGDNYPAIPSNPSPANGEDSVDYANVTLSWACSDPDPGDTLTYYVYMGFDPVNLYLTYSDLTSPTVNAGALAPHTTYYWYIKVHDLTGNLTTGPVWSFTTMFPPAITAEFTASQDGNAYLQFPTTVFNTDTLQVGALGQYDMWYTFIDFNTSSLPPLPIIVSATLRLYAAGTGIGLPFVISVGANMEPWNENLLTWDYSPPYSNPMDPMRTIPNQLSGWIEIDVQGQIQEMVDHEWDYGLALISNNWLPGNPVHLGRFLSSETAYPPTLTITYHEQ